MNNNLGPQNMTAKDLANKVLLPIKELIKEHVAARKNRPLQLQPYNVYNNKQPPMSPTDLAKKVIPALKQFVQEHVAAHKNRPQQQIVGGYLQAQNQNQPYYPPEGSQTAYQQQGQRPSNQNRSRQGQEKEIRECLEAHNKARRNAPGVRRPDLIWDDRLARHARQWAEHLIQINGMEHDLRGTGEGENIYMLQGDGGSRQGFKQAVELWNEEIKHYHGQKIGQRNLGDYGHYTQNIWPTTTHVGMARATGRGTQIIVARYSPQGNIMGRTAHE